MEPIELAITLELGSLLIAVVGGLATWLNHRGQKAARHDRARHQRAMMALQERQHQEHLALLRQGQEAAHRTAEECLTVGRANHQRGEVPAGNVRTQA